MSDLDAAFARAAQARQAIAGVVATVRSGETDLAGAFAMGDADPLIGRVFAVKVLEAVPDIGKVRARRTMEELGLDEAIWLDQVPAASRTAIAQAFAEAAPS